MSTTDAIGSESGPNSHEMIDNLLRLDLDLGSFLDDLEKTFGKGNVLFVLGGDHGVMQLPEYLSRVQHVAARRFSNRALAEQSGRILDSLMRIEHGINEWLVKGTLINYPAIKRASLNPAVIEGRIRDTLMKIDGIADVVFRSELLDKKTALRPYLEAFRHSFLSERSPDIFIRDCENCLVTDAKTGTSHGSPYLYDRVVPIAFWGSGKAPQRIERSVHTVDIAATLAAMFKLPAPKNLDGVPLREVTR